MRAAVVGGGLAGCAAALRLREGGAEVTLFSRGPGASAMGGGTLDFAAVPRPGEALGSSAPAERVATLMRSNPVHPYHRFGSAFDCVQRMDTALRALENWTRSAGLRIAGRSDRGLLLSDSDGGLRCGDAALASIAAGSIEGFRDIAVVSVPGLRAWCAPAVADRLQAEVAALGTALPRVTALECAWPAAWADAGEVPARLASWLDEPGALPELLVALEALAKPDRLLLLPPVLGLAPDNPLAAALGERLPGTVAECVGAPPLTLAGLRVVRALEASLDRAGVDRRRSTVVAATPRSGGVDLGIAPCAAAAAEAIGADPDTALEPFDRVVLATGRFVGGGIRDADAGLEEPLLGLPLWDPATASRVDGRSGQSLTHSDWERAQTLFRVGVGCDPRQRPLRGGDPVSPHLFAAGELLGGFDAAVDRSGHGTALLSGLFAAEGALESEGRGEGGGSPSRAEGTEHPRAEPLS